MSAASILGSNSHPLELTACVAGPVGADGWETFSSSNARDPCRSSGRPCDSRLLLGQLDADTRRFRTAGHCRIRVNSLSVGKFRV
jgi:hypothetical protein